MFFTSCSHSDNALIHIPEASGICYEKSSDSLFVANDEGSVYEISTNGKILRKKRLGHYDIEGVACDGEKGKLYFAVEKSDNILVVNQKNLTVIKEIDIKRKFKNLKVLKKDRKNGLEGIAITPYGIYLSNQSFKAYPNEDPSVLIKIDSLDKNKVAIKDIVDHGYMDIAALSFYDGYLYMVSDSENLLIKYDIKNRKTISTKKLQDFDQEGVTFDDNGYIYFADDNGKIIKYNFKGLMK
jgi:uncharacterized protein YjiK